VKVQQVKAKAWSTALMGVISVVSVPSSDCTRMVALQSHPATARAHCRVSAASTAPSLNKYYIDELYAVLFVRPV
jgi:hypothetical protein